MRCENCRWWPVGSIRNGFVRKVGVLIVFPLAMIWFFNWRLIAWPLAVLWNALEDAAYAFGQSVADDCNTRSIRLLRAGMAGVWSGRFQPTQEEE